MKAFRNFVLVISLVCLASCKQEAKKAPTDTETQIAADTLIDYTALGSKLLYVDWDYDAAKKTLLKAVELNPKDDLSQANLAWYWMLEGNKDKSMEHIEMAKKANPDNMLWVQWHGWMCYFYDDFECADKYLRQAIAMQPAQRDAYFTLARMNYRNGNLEEALQLSQRAAQDSTGRVALSFHYILKGEHSRAREIAEAIETGPKDPYELLGLVPLYNMIGEKDKSLQWLEKNYELRQPLLPWLRFMPIMRPLHGEERFDQLVEKIGAPSGS